MFFIWSDVHSSVHTEPLQGETLPFGLPIVLSRFWTRERAISPLFESALEYTVFNQTFLDPSGSKHSRVVLDLIPSDLPRHSNQRQQTSDVLWMWEHFVNQQCYGHKLLLWMEDDFILCDGAEVDLFFVVNWAKSHWQSWSAIRIGYGHSGLVLKCNTMRDVVARLRGSREKSIDYLVSNVLRKQEKNRYRVYR